MKINTQEYYLNGKTLILRSPTMSDAKLLMDYFIKINSETKFLGREPKDIKLTLKKEKELLKKYNESKTDTMILGLLDGKLVGTCSVNVSNASRTKHNGTLGIGLFKKFNSKGIGTIMFTELIEYCKQIGLEQVDLRVHADNLKARGLYKKLGFKECGVLKNYEKYKDGSYSDIMLMQRSIKR